ncbi:MAG TPA: hypothetical protein VE870_15565 [Bacteroidales bacterium]|nr:hypothetical protein [Bacteroidales bacterium]
MKKLNYLALFTFAAMVLSSCVGLNKMQESAADVSYKVTPPVLAERGDKVDVKVDVKYPAKYFNKNAVVTATPVLKYADGETAFESKTVQGEKVEANNQVISYANGGSFTYSGSVPFKKDMMKSDLVIRVNAELKGKTIQFDDYKIGEGVIATEKLVMVDPKPIMVGDKFQRIIPDSYMADILYIINRADVRNSQVRKETIEELVNYIKNADTNERIDLKGVDVSAYASPDGPYDFNDNLSQKREATSTRFMERELKKEKVEKAKEENFLAAKYTPEDWEGFKKLMEESNVPDKELVLRVLSMYSDPAVREREIKNISEAFDVIKKEILPPLRRAKLTANVDMIGLSDEEIKNVWSSDPDSLKLEEILYAATLYNDLDTKLAIYKKASENYPKCFRAINNVGYVYVLMNKPEQAQPAFEKAKQLQDNDVVNNNLGVVALMQGDVDKAEQLFTSSMGAGQAVNYNLGIIKIMQGDYDAASNYLGNADEYNVALVQLLQGNVDGAMATINKVNGDFAKKYYLKAVISARQDKDEMVFENLRLAVAKDASLKDRATVDMEFAKYFDNDTFKNIVE